MKRILLTLAISGCAGLFANTGTLTYIPPRAASDLEPLVAKLAEPFHDLNPTDEMLYGYLTDKDWSYGRHEISGVIVSREVSALFGYRHADGTCGVQVLVVGQENLGGDDYGKLYVRNIHGHDGMANYYYRPAPCPELAKAEQVLRDQGCPECVVSAP